MTKFEKPITEKQQELATLIYKFLHKEHRFVTKEEICEMLGWEYNLTNDRKVRDTINIIKKIKPIVATPDRKGYFAPKFFDIDEEEVDHQLNYIDSIIDDLLATKQPLLDFKKKAKEIKQNVTM